MTSSSSFHTAFNWISGKGKEDGDVINGGVGGDVVVNGGGFQSPMQATEDVGSTETLDGRKKKQSMYVKNKLAKGSR